MEIDR